ncbi:hypothetical protein Tco_0140345 [Tanacetum coccineum]
MAKQQTIMYSPQWNNMTMDDVVFQTNNVVGNFQCPPNVPAYKPIMKFLLNCLLNKPFTNYPLVVYQNFLREFWSTVVAFDPFPSTDEPEKCPLREFLIKFSVLNGQRPLTLDFKTFCSTTGLDYNNGKYVAHPAPKVMKKELGKITINPSYLDKTPVLKNSFHVAWRIMFTFVIQVLGRNYSSTEQVNSIQQLLAFSLITGTEVDIEEIIYSDLVTKLLNNSRLKYVSYPRFILCALQVLLGGNKQPLDRDTTSITPIEGTSKTTPHPEGSLRDKDLGGNIPPTNMEPIYTPVADPLGTGAKYQVDETQSTRLRYRSLTKNKGKTYVDIQAFMLSDDELDKESDEEEVLAARDAINEDPQDDKEVRTPSPKQE